MMPTVIFGGFSTDLIIVLLGAFFKPLLCELFVRLRGIKPGKNFNDSGKNIKNSPPLGIFSWNPLRFDFEYGSFYFS
jgi:hypothetical protein